MRIFTSSDHDGVWVCGVSVVVAETEPQARNMLLAALRTAGVHEPKDDFTMVEIDPTKAHAYVLDNGDY